MAGLPSPDLELPQPPEGPRAFDPSQSAGLFVGISEFEDRRIRTVPYAVDDAVDLAFFFVVEQSLLVPDRTILTLAGEPRKPESIKRLQELRALRVEERRPTMRELYRALSDVRKTTEEGGLLLVTVASHGLTDQGADLVVAADSFAERMAKTGLSLNDVFDEVAKARAPRRLVLLDTCRERLMEGTRGLHDDPMSASFAGKIENAKGQAVLSGTTHGGYSYDDPKRQNGVFSAAVLAGLRGGAKADGEGWITVHELAGYLQKEVSRWVEDNRPTNEPFRGIGQRIDGPGGLIRLVRHPEVSAQTERYRVRRQAAERRLKENLGGILTGGLYDLVMALLPEKAPGERSEDVLAEIELLDGTLRAKRSLRDLILEGSQSYGSAQGVLSAIAETAAGTNSSASVAEERFLLELSSELDQDPTGSDPSSCGACESERHTSSFGALFVSQNLSAEATALGSAEDDHHDLKTKFGRNQEPRNAGKPDRGARSIWREVGSAVTMLLQGAAILLLTLAVLEKIVEYFSR